MTYLDSTSDAGSDFYKNQPAEPKTYDNTSYDKSGKPDKGGPSPSLDDLSAPPGLAAIVGEKYRAAGAIGTDILRQADIDKARRDKAFAATEIGPDSVLFKGWNSEEETRKFSTNPLDAFGSLGSIFGIIGAAFTHAPMQAGMEAAASAINAINAGDEKAYERAHQAFKDNVDLALKRHQIMEERYRDASSILSDNLNLGLSKMKIAAEISGDKQAAFLAEHGMVKEWYDLQEKRADAALKVKEASDKLTFEKMMDEVYRRSPEAKSGDPLVQMGQYYKTHNIDQPPVQQALFALRLKAIKEHWDEDKFIDEAGKVYQKFQHQYGLTPAFQAKEAEKATKFADASDQLDSAIADIDKQLKGGSPVVGALGFGERLLETGKNIVGMSQETPAYVFQTKIRLLQNEIPRIIAGTTRISAQERAHLDQIVAGLGALTSAQQAKAALLEVKQILDKYRPANVGSGPQVGDVQDGYRFKGGDPANPKNWMPEQ